MDYAESMNTLSALQLSIGFLCGAICGIAACTADLYARCDSFHFKKEQVLSRRSVLILVIGLLAGLIGIWIHGQFGMNYLGYLLLNTCLLSVSGSDIDTHELPVAILAVFAIAGLLWRICWQDMNLMIDGVLGAAGGSAILAIPYLLKKGSVGKGDLMLLAVCGIYAGLSEVFYLLLRALILMAVWGIVQLLRKKATSGSELPLAPFLFVAALV